MSRSHQTTTEKNKGDKVYTPDWCAKDLVAHFAPTGRVLEPCRGKGSIFNNLPENSFWCELDEGKDFFQFHHTVDWIISNPPYSQTRAFMRHAFKIASNVVFLVPARNIVSGYGTVIEGASFGGLKEVRWYGTGSRLGFPMGNAIAAFYWKRGHRSSCLMSFYEYPELSDKPSPDEFIEDPTGGEGHW